jgi:hypothetical protein
MPEPKDQISDTQLQRIVTGGHTPLIWGEDLYKIPETQPLIEGVLDLDSTAILYGDSYTGKSLIALDWALSIATGIAWDGRKVQPGRVLYIVGEGLSGTRPRAEAWKIQSGVGYHPNLALGPHAPNLLSDRGREELRWWVGEADPVFTILDTVARHIPGGDENEFQTISYVVETLDWIKETTGGCALAVHHTGKDHERGARGHSSLRAAMDTEIRCTKEANGPLNLTLTKQKNGEAGFSIGKYNLEKIASSVVTVPVDRKLNPNEQRIIAVLTPDKELTWSDIQIESQLSKSSLSKVLARMVERGELVSGTTGTKSVFRLP